MRQQVLSCKDLRAASYGFDSPFRLKLEGEQELTVERVLRIIPKRRMVVLGNWQGRAIVAKLFFAEKNAAKHMDKDVAGIQRLLDNKIPTPRIYAKTLTEDKQTQVLILQHIADSQNLEMIWQQAKHPNDIMPTLYNVIVELATQHVLGIVQQDLHLKNFLCTEKVIYTLDGAQIELFPHLLPKNQSMQNLALFLAQFGAGVEDCQEKLFRFYAKSRGWLLKKEDITELFFLIKTWNEKRWMRFAKKIFRDSTHFACKQDWQTFSMHNRAYANSPEFIAFLKQPEIAFTHASTIHLKSGRSSTVVKITLDGHELVVKRYNIKNAWHFLRRCLRPTRAFSSWRLAQKLQLFGIPTAAPVAFIEKHFLNLRGTSYYVTEYVAGQHAYDYFQNHQDTLQPEMIQPVAHLLKTLTKVSITHGDLKATNILINAEGKPVLIDLDGATEHVSLAGLHHAWRKEIKRFLKNFYDQPHLLDQFKEILSRE